MKKQKEQSCCNAFWFIVFVILQHLALLKAAALTCGEIAPGWISCDDNPDTCCAVDEEVTSTGDSFGLTSGVDKITQYGRYQRRMVTTRSDIAAMKSSIQLSLRRYNTLTKRANDVTDSSSNTAVELLDKFKSKILESAICTYVGEENIETCDNTPELPESLWIGCTNTNVNFDFNNVNCDVWEDLNSDYESTIRSSSGGSSTYYCEDSAPYNMHEYSTSDGPLPFYPASAVCDDNVAGSSCTFVCAAPGAAADDRRAEGTCLDGIGWFVGDNILESCRQAASEPCVAPCGQSFSWFRGSQPISRHDCSGEQTAPCISTCLLNPNVQFVPYCDCDSRRWRALTSAVDKCNVCPSSTVGASGGKCSTTPRWSIDDVVVTETPFCKRVYPGDTCEITCKNDLETSFRATCGCDGRWSTYGFLDCPKEAGDEDDIEDFLRSTRGIIVIAIAAAIVILLCCGGKYFCCK